MIAVITFVAALIIFLGGLAAVASGCRNELRRRGVPKRPGEEVQMTTEIEEWLKQQQ